MPIQQMLLGAGGAAAAKTYVDDVFSTYVYPGSSSGVTVNNGVDLSGEGGLVWIKHRDTINNVSEGHYLFDTVRGDDKQIESHSNATESTIGSAVFDTFNSNGFTVGNHSRTGGSGQKFASWTFRKAKGFFDVVTWSGNATSGRQISHDLGCVPGAIFTKRLNVSENWLCYHKSMGNEKYIHLNLDNVMGDATYWNDTDPTSTYFTVNDAQQINGDGYTYVAYLFAGNESTAATARSVDFDGTGDYLSFAASNDFHLSGDFTIECWVKPEDNANEHIFALGSYGTDEGVLCYIYSDKLYVKTTGTNDLIVADPGPPIGQWTHVAVVRSGSTVNVYLDGTLTKSYTYNTGWGSDSNKTFYIGGSHPGSQFFDGKISNFRVVKGTAVYTSSFRVPTEPLTNITNTKLLCCNNSSTTGSTVTPGTITANGDPTASTDSPFDDPTNFVFGANEDQNIIKCGSYEGNNADDGTEVFLGFEPSFLLIKSVDTADNWCIFDNLRGMTVDGVNDQALFPNESDAEAAGGYLTPTSTGFKLTTQSDRVNNNSTYIYMAIRRPDGYVGKPIEDATKCFTMDTGSGSSTIPNYDASFAVDMALRKQPGSTNDWRLTSRLTGTKHLITNGDAAESSYAAQTFDSNAGWSGDENDSSHQSWMWQRHAGFDVVAYTGNGTAGHQIRHSLSKSPEMIWVKDRENTRDWRVFHHGLNGGSNPAQYGIKLNSNEPESQNSSYWNDTAPTSTSFTIGTSNNTNNSSTDYLALLFASVEGISKVGYYDGTGSNDHSITTGFQPRFILIKVAHRADGYGGGWHNFDTLRGINAGNEYPLSLQSSQADSAMNHLDYIDLDSDGFTIQSTSLSFNGSNARYIYYAHA